MAFLKRITPYAIAVLLLAVFYVRVPPPLRKTPYEHLQTFSLYRADLPSVQATPYDFLMFVVQWPFAVCANKKCTNKSLPNNFTIHGLWPKNNSRYWDNCTGTPFSSSEMDRQPKLKTKLSVSWPNLKGKNMAFWEKQYNKHGSCCDDTFTQTEYFQTAHNMWSEHHVEKMFEDAGCTPGTKYERHKLKAAVKNKTKNNPALRCRKDSNVLEEVVICYDHNGTEVIECNSTLLDKCGSYETILWEGPPMDV
ncbi:hypothetical protein M0R45_009878 [Rubus argutus]|uniref:Uncharacterized protein n=1 Tax=Rubus argutus TaxID=59490 RepID=A0AAW1Y784_RUBAR